MRIREEIEKLQSHFVIGLQKAEVLAILDKWEYMGGKMKLTKPQKRALLNFLQYHCVAYVSSPDGHSFFGHPCPRNHKDHKVRWRTLYALEDKGLISNITPDNWCGGKYALTQEGEVLALGIMEEVK